MRRILIGLLLGSFAAACNPPKPPAPEDYVERLTQARQEKDIQLKKLE